MSDDDDSLPDLIDENEELYQEINDENNEMDENELVNFVFTENMRDDEVEEVVREMVDHILSTASNDYRSYYFSTDDLFTYAIELIDDDDTIYNDTLLRSLQDCECLRKNENINIDFNSFPSTEELEACCICMNKIVEKEIITTIKCNHTFHLNCIKEWSQYKADCPVCREKI